MTTPPTLAGFQADLEQLLGLKTVRYKHGLSKEQLFEEAIENDRGRVKKGGGTPTRRPSRPSSASTDRWSTTPIPTAPAGRVKDTYAVAWPEVAETDLVEGRPPALRPGQVPGPAEARRRAPERQEGARSTSRTSSSAPDPGVRDALPLRRRVRDARDVRPQHVPEGPARASKDAERRRWTMLNVPSLHCEPGARRLPLRSARSIIDIKNRICLVAGRADYCGVVKKTIFTV